MRKFVAIVGGVGVLGATLLGPIAPVSAAPLSNRPFPAIEKAYPNETYTQYYHRRYHHHHHYYHGGGGDAVAAGVVGLAAGALIAGAIASQAQPASPPPPPGTVSPSVAAYCARKYRSYDPASGTFLATNGMRYVCTYP